MSKNDYVITSDGELYHWKYIDRKKVKGKWVYTYPGEGKGRPNGAAEQKPTVSKEYEEELAYNSQKNSFSTDKSSNTQARAAVNAGKSAVNASVKGSSEYEAEKAYNSQKNVYPTPQPTTKKSETEKDKSFMDKLKDKIDDLVDDAKDKLGYDERERYEKAQKLQKNVEATTEKVTDRFNKTWKEYDAEAKGHKWYEDTETAEQFRKIARWENVSEAAAKETDKAWNDFLSTPLGALKNPKEAANKVVSDIKDRLGYDEKEKRDDAAIGLKVSNSFLDSAQEGLRDEINDRRRYGRDEKHVKNAMKSVRWAMEERTEDAKKYVEAQEEFNKTPLGKVYKVNNAAKDWITSLFDSDKSAKEVRSKVDSIQRQMEETEAKEEAAWDAVRDAEKERYRANDTYTTAMTKYDEVYEAHKDIYAKVDAWRKNAELNPNDANIQRIYERYVNDNREVIEKRNRAYDVMETARKDLAKAQDKVDKAADVANGESRQLRNLERKLTEAEIDYERALDNPLRNIDEWLEDLF